MRIPVGTRFFAYVQTGPGAYPASYTMGTGSFPGVKRLGRGADHPPPTSEGNLDFTYDLLSDRVTSSDYTFVLI
jgi:hypothetical protein